MLRYFIYLALFCGAFTFDDVEKKCQPGEKIVSLKRASDGKSAQRLSAECGPMKPSADAIKSPNCQEGKPLSCNGKPEGCPTGSWLAGINFYQLDSSSSVDLMVPVCCTADNVAVDQCYDQRLNSAYSAIDSSVGDNGVYQNVTCWALEDSSSKPPKLTDAIFKVGTCKYNVQGGAAGGASSPPPAAAGNPTTAAGPPPPAQTSGPANPAVTTTASVNKPPPPQKNGDPSPAPTNNNGNAQNANSNNGNAQKGPALPFRKQRPNT